MILRLSNRPARGILVLLGFALTSLFCYSGTRNTLALHNASLNTPEGYQRAVRLEPTDARNWYLLGRYWQYNLEDPDAQQAIHSYQRSLSLSPHSADTWSDLAMAYELENNLPAARDAFLEAQRAYPLSPEVAWRFGNFLLRRGELDAAFEQIKRSVQVDPKRGAAAFALCMRVEPDINAVLDRALPQSPGAYLSVMSGLAEQQKTEQALVVWSRLVALHPHLTLGDSGALIESLLHKLQTTEAQQVWSETLALAGVSRPSDPPGSLVWDGGFESNITNVGFTWRYSTFVNGVQVGLDLNDKHSGHRSLRLTFNGLINVDFRDVCQYIAVQPSVSYRLSGWVQTRSLSTDQGIRFTLHSVGDSTNSVEQTDDLRGTQPWTQIEYPWTAARDVRELQLCITRERSAKFDSKIRGSAWVDDVTLTPVSAENAKQ
jgi:hypothetical protein